MKAAGRQRARRCARLLNGLGWVAFVWSFFPTPYGLVAAVAACLPFAAVVAVRYFGRHLRLEPVSRRDDMAVFTAFLMPLLGLALMALRTNILAWQMFWVPFGLASIALFVTTYTSATDVRTKAQVLLPVLIFCLVYGASFTVVMNRLSAWTPPEQHQAKVLAKRVSKGKHTSYYLKLAPWGPRTTPDDVRVSRTVFERKNKGDVAEIVVNKGLFCIPWFQVR